MARQRILRTGTTVCAVFMFFAPLRAQFTQVYLGKVNGAEWVNAYYGSANQTAAAFADLDNDGDLDLLQGSRSRLEWLKNTGTSQIPAWEPLNWGNIDITDNKYWTPALFDLDGDGDQDMVCGQSDGTLAYFQNLGNAKAPTWGNPINNWKNIDAGSRSKPAFCDIDGDGDADLFIGNSTGKIFFHENTGTTQSPGFQQKTDSYVATGRSAPMAPFFADIDGDGDFDLLVSNVKDRQISFFRNTGSRQAAAWTLVTDQYAGVTTPASNPMALMADLDADSDLDLFITDDDGFFHFYRNTWTTAAPAWSYQHGNANLSLDFGQSSAPALGDFDGDGDLDALVGTSFVYVLKNAGSPAAPAWEWTGIRAVDLNDSYLCPEMADIDGDGDLDLFVGTNSGRLYFFRNNGTKTTINLVQATDNYIGMVFGGNTHVSAEFGDIDGDGDQDMFVEHYKNLNDSLIFCRNTGTPSQPEWQLVDRNYLNLGGFGISFGSCELADMDLDGDLDALFGDGDGKFYQFENTGNANAPAWTFQGVIAGGLHVENNFTYSAPALGDIDGDSYPDLVSGLYGGGLNIWLNTAGATGAARGETDVPVSDFRLLGSYPNPFNPYAAIEFDLPRPARVLLDVVDASGRVAAVLADDNLPSGVHRIEWNAGTFPAGVYFCRLRADGRMDARKMLLLK